MVFTKETSNPVLTFGAGGTWDDERVYIGRVLYRNNKWYMYYGGYDGGSFRTGLAMSGDGISWTKHPNNPILNVGTGGSWDYIHARIREVLYRNNKWYMYYTGYGGLSYKIGLATSTDGITWTKHPSNPVLSVGGAGTWDYQQAYAPSVIYRNNKWYMYYNGRDVSVMRIGLATSVDGITWMKHPDNPILNIGAGGAWDDTHLFSPNVIYRNNKWYLYYAGLNGGSWKTGLATSGDGITWTKHPDNPILDVGAADTWDDVHVFMPSVIYRNNKWYLYYLGYDGASYRIGLATSPSGV